MMIDTHCHIYNSEMENAEEIIRKAGKNNIQVILNGTDPSSNMEVLELSSKHENAHAALGYLYTFADDATDEDIVLLDKQLEDENVVGVGEIGLDYYRTRDNMDRQNLLFEEMLRLAQKHGLPVIVHSRKAMQDTFDILKKYDVVGSMHAYQGSAEMAREFIKLGFYIGIGGPVTHVNNRKVKRTLKMIGVGHVLLETDSPYMAPEGKRDEPNTPLNLGHIVGKIADELGMAEDEVMDVTTANAKRLFHL